jgi:hypothetical protein
MDGERTDSTHCCFLFRSASPSDCLCWKIHLRAGKWATTMRNAPESRGLPLHLTEICTMLAIGLVRLRRYCAVESVRPRRPRATESVLYTSLPRRAPMRLPEKGDTHDHPADFRDRRRAGRAAAADDSNHPTVQRAAATFCAADRDNRRLEAAVA